MMRAASNAKGAVLKEGNGRPIVVGTIGGNPWSESQMDGFSIGSQN